jgi:hypothetical protein
MAPLKLLIPAATAAFATACTAGAGAVVPHAVDEQRALHALRAQLRGPVAQSPVFRDGRARDIAVAVMKQLANPAVPEVDIYRWQRRTWRPLAHVDLDVGGSVAADANATTTPISTVDLTAAKPPELVVTVHYNAGPATAVISAVGGSWHALTYHGGLTQDGHERFDAHVHADGTITSHENDCVPNCAQGHTVTTAYRFVPATGQLEAYTNR